MSPPHEPDRMQPPPIPPDASQHARAVRHHRHSMSFEKLIEKVTQAEDALEAQERRFAADVRQLKRSWRAAWTPGRIVIAGLVTGFVTGRAEPLRSAARSGSVVRIVSLLSGLFATATAQAAAGHAEDAAESAELATETVAPGAVAGQRVSANPPLESL